MKLGVLTVPLQNIPAEEAFAYLSGLGVQALELGTGGYTCACHLDVEGCLADDNKVAQVKALLEMCIRDRFSTLTGRPALRIMSAIRSQFTACSGNRPVCLKPMGFRRKRSSP